MGRPPDETAPARREQGLTMPSPARELWLASRDIVKDTLARIQSGVAAYSLTGGTILASRWNHRQSFDIDIVVPESTPLHQASDPTRTDFIRRIAGIGGSAAYSEELNKLKVTFADRSEIDLWARAPVIGGTNEREIMEGRNEHILSTAQILRGKLERSDLNLVRDVYDITQARRCDPQALQIAANAMPRRSIENIAWAWHHADPVFREDAPHQLRGTREPRPERENLGTRAAQAIHDSLYDRLVIRAGEDRITIETLSAARDRTIHEVRPDHADEYFEKHGLNAHFANRNPGPDILREHAKVLARASDTTTVIYREERSRVVYWNGRPGARSGPKTLKTRRPDPNLRHKIGE